MPSAELASKLASILSSAPHTLHVVNPSTEILTALIAETPAHDTLPTLRIYAPKQTYTETFTNYPLTAIAHDLTETHDTTFRITALTAPPALLFDNTIFLIVESYLIETEHRELSSDIQTHLSENWDHTDKYEFTQPSTTTLLHDISQHFNTDTTLDAQTLLHALTHTPVSLEQFLVILAARNNITNAELATYADTRTYTNNGEIGRARFTLERADLISTETTNQHTRGRPTYRLIPTENLTTNATPILTDTLTTALD